MDFTGMTAAAGIDAIAGSAQQIYAASQQQGADKRARAFAREVGQNQIQWRAADMEAAGINPILAAGQLGHTSVPSGTGKGGGQSAKGTNFLQAATAKKQAELTTASTSKVQAEAIAAESNAALTVATNDAILSEGRNLDAHIRKNLLGQGGTATMYNILSDAWQSAWSRPKQLYNKGKEWAGKFQERSKEKNSFDPKSFPYNPKK